MYTYVHIFSHERFSLNRHLRRLWDVLSSSFSYIIKNLNGYMSYTMYGMSLILLTFFTRFQRSLSLNENYNENSSCESYEVYQKNIYVSIKFIALYIYSNLKNTKISIKNLIRHEIILQMFISSDLKFHQFIKCDDRFVHYIIFTLYLIALYRSLLGLQVKLLPYLILLCISTSRVSLSRIDTTFGK